MDQSTRTVRLAHWQTLSGNVIYEQQASHPSNEVTTTGFVEVPTIGNVAMPKQSVTAVIRMNGCQIELSNAASKEFLQQLLGALAYAQDIFILIFCETVDILRVFIFKCEDKKSVP